MGSCKGGIREMNTQDRLKQWKIHDSMRGYFGYHLYRQMALNKDIVIITGDLGWGLFNAHREDMPSQFINAGASEQAMMGVACGMALQGKTVFVYSITPFLIYRAFETIRTYVNHESIPLKLIGSGRDDDYKHDGYSHNAHDVQMVLATQGNIIQLYPDNKEDMEQTIDLMIKTDEPFFLSLKR